MIRSVLYLEPKGGDHQAVVDMFRQQDVLGRAVQQPGCLGSELHVPTSGNGPILVTALWASAEAYEGWITSPARAEGAAELVNAVEGSLDESTRGETYVVAISAGQQVPASGGDA